MNKEEIARKLFFDGLSFLEKNDLRQAEACFSGAADLMPERLSVLLNLSNVLIRLKKFKRADEILTVALQVDPSNHQAWFNRGLLKKESHDYQEAINSFDIAHTIDPRNNDTLDQLGECVVFLSEELRRKFINSNELVTIAHQRVRTNQILEAINCLRDGLELLPWRSRIKVELIGLLLAAQEINEAEKLINQARGERPESYDLLLYFSMIARIRGDLNQAKKILLRLIEIKPKNYDVLMQLGTVFGEAGELEAALGYFRHAGSINPGMIESRIKEAETLQRLSRHRESIDIYDNLISQDPRNAGLFINKGLALDCLGRYEDAIQSYKYAISIDAKRIEVWSNLSATYLTLKRYRESLIAADQALQIDEKYSSAWSNRSAALYFLNQFSDSLVSADKAIEFNSSNHSAWLNRSNVLHRINQLEDALFSVEQALKINPSYIEALYAKGGILATQKNHLGAICCFRQAIAIDPNYGLAWTALGLSLHARKQYGSAKDAFLRALKLNSEIDYLPGYLLNSKMQCCDWENYSGLLEMIRAEVELGRRVIMPFTALAVFDDPRLQHKVSRIYGAHLYPESVEIVKSPKKSESGRIKVGYFSADFGEHPVAYLVSQLFEVHDRTKFEIFGFSINRHPDSTIRERIKKGFDHFYDVAEESDENARVIARDLNLHIAVDLTGYTASSRTGIFTPRIAPIQVNYLGYPGTLGVNYFDYVIVDRTIHQIEFAESFSEKIVILPNCYQPNDLKRQIVPRSLSRADCGLPEQGFVFCCFNNNFKINPHVYDVWMEILRRCPGAVLWLFQDSAEAASNLIAETDKRGVDSRRIVFAPRAAHITHLSRYHLADLFLDTFPYNAHTTASDSLWAGTPVLTIQGNSFAGRVAMSLLEGVGLGVLVAHNETEYIELATELAHNPSKLKSYKEALDVEKRSLALFDIYSYTKSFENALLAMVERLDKGEPLGNITIEAH